MGSNWIHSHPLGYVSCPARASSHASSHTNTYTNYTNADSHTHAYTDPHPYSHAESRRIATAPGAISFPFDQSMEF